MILPGLGGAVVAEFVSDQLHLNVISALFNKEGAPYLRLGTVHPPQTELPNDIANWVMAYVARLDLELEVTG